MKKHVNIPVFIPHYGCPNACVFCNQKKITGKPSYDRDSVRAEIDEALSTVDTEHTEVELAFFGGSFTAIPRGEMLGLLEISDSYLKDGRISSVRLSTRPDAISDEILDILSQHGVKTVELGLQSFSDTVLLASKRGHTSAVSEKACKDVIAHGFKLIGQMMVGLPSSTLSDEIMTAKRICELGASGARVYPTVVFPETELCEMEKRGTYSSLTVDGAISRTAEVLTVFAEHGVPVIRIGLCANETLADHSYSESYHPSVGELSLNLMYLKLMRASLNECADRLKENAVFYVARGKISQAVGQKKANVTRLKEEYGLKSIKVAESDSLSGFQLMLKLTDNLNSNERTLPK